MKTDPSISNPNPRKLPGPELLHELVPRESQDGSVAIEFSAEDGNITRLEYGEFHERADLLARRIVQESKRRPSQGSRFIVPILIPQTPDLYISQLASLKAGGAFCPIVLDAPEERLRFILKDTEASVLLTTTALRIQIPSFDGVEVIAVDDGYQSTDTTPLDLHLTPQQAAYVMYTSGSTGQPKGVVISHSAATQALLAHDMHIPKFSRFLQFASPTFDVSVFEIFFPWFRQCTLVSCDRRRLLNDLPSVISDLDIDACELTPSVASSLLRGRSSVPSLKVLLTIGEMLKPSVVQEFGGDSSETAILHGMYGPTEATIHCTLQTSFPKDMVCGMIGLPLETVSAFVVKAQEDSSGSPKSVQILPLGEEGELAVGGHQLADGYLNREEQTKAAFVEHPEYGLLYRTGDRAKMRPDGKLECLGRISNGQVKLRGQRIELGEIEHVASRTPGCRDVVAEVIQGILVVFCVCETPSVAESTVLKTCRAWLPSFMVPGEVVLLDALPYLASGKCDRKALREQYTNRQDHSTDDDADHGAVARDVTNVIASVFSSQVQTGSTLSSLGVDSIMSIRIAGALRKAGFRQLDANQVLAANTPLEISLMLDNDDKMEHSMSTESYRNSVDEALSQQLPPTLLAELEDSFPCTPIQVAMLAETQKQANAYCNWVEFRAVGFPDCPVVAEALRELVNQHPMLRSGFIPITGTQWSFATVIWKTASTSQIQETEDFDRQFTIESDAGLLHPCNFQIMSSEQGCRILLRAHHSIFDQWSVDLLGLDLAAILEGRRHQRPNSFRLVVDFYVDRLHDGAPAPAIEFWQQALQDVSPTTLPLLHAREVPSTLSRTQWRQLSEAASSFRAQSRQLNCSTPSILQAALAMLLGVYTGSSDVVFGSVFSGRNLPIDGIDAVFGPCFATLPLRIDTGTASTCADLLGALTERTRAMQRHVSTPLTSIRSAAGIAPGVTLFDTLFVWQETTFNEANQGSSIRLLDSMDQLEFKMVLEFEPTPSQIQMRATYEESLISPDQVDVFLRQIDALASIMTTFPELPTQETWSRISPNLLSIANPDPMTYGDKFELTAIIQQNAWANPSATAILFARTLTENSFETSSISYSELETRANRMAHHFIAAGLKPQGLVCVCMEKCIDLYVVLLACFKAGAGYLPLVPETPEARVRSIFTQTAIDLCVCDADTAPILERLTDVPVLDNTRTIFSSSPDTPPEIEQAGSRVSYAVFTSGSTGEPKGVAVTMDNLKGNLGVLSELYQVQSGDRLLQACSQAFDVSVFEIFFAFYSGMCLCTATKDVMFQDFEESIRRFKATHLSLTPTVAALVRPENVPSVKFLVTAGEGITEKVHRLWSGRGLHQGYGPSETTNICSVKMHHSPKDVLGNIGPPFCNTSAFVLSPNEDFSILPAGSYGEFAFGGEQVFRGYIGRDDLNSAKIINHPLYGRVYKSGDMGRILPDGTLLISGRLDDQVKIRGNRVELGEINTIVADHPEVFDCTTMVLGEGSSRLTLVTYFVPTSYIHESSPTISVVDVSPHVIFEIFSRLQDALPTYMMPSTLVPLNRLPVTSQGKLDKRILRQVMQNIDPSHRERLSRSHETSSGEGLASPMEQTMAETLAEVLDVPLANISRNTSFFALGLNSLNAMQFAKSLQKKLGLVVGVTGILRHSSLARLAQIMSKSPQARKNSSRDLTVFSNDTLESIKSLLAKRSLTCSAILPCTPLQQAMLSASVSNSSEAYCNTTKLSILGELDRLREVWDVMMERHAILRTTFVETTSAAHPYAQVVLKDPPKVWHNLRKDSAHVNRAPNGHANGNANGHASHAPRLPPVSPESPLSICQDGVDLYLQMHHAIYDGISVANLFEEMMQLYGGQSLPPPVSFEPFLAEVMRQNGADARQFWKERMQGFQPSSLPSKSSSTDDQEDVADRTILLSPETLQAFCERNSVTNLSVFQAAWVKVLACTQQTSDICFGNVVSGRSVSVAEVDRLVAPCFNTVPFRSRLNDIRTNLGLIQDLQRINIDAMPFQLTAVRQIQALSQKPSIRLFDSLLLLQPPLQRSELWTVEEDSMDMGIPLAVEVIPCEETYELQIHYLPSTVPRLLASALADAFIASLMSCLRYPSSGLGHFVDFDSSQIAGRLEPERIPATANGELNDHTRSQAAQHWSETEQTIRKTFAQLAEVDQDHISRNTSLYQIGLDSLNAVQVASKLRQQGFKMDAADVMQHQTPVGLAAFLESRRASSAPNEASYDLRSFDKTHRPRVVESLGLDERSVEAVCACTPTQSGMLAQFLQAEGAYYMSHSVYEVPENISFDTVRDAWRAVECKHKVLRMGFHQTEDATIPFAMIIYRPGEYFDKVDLSKDLAEEASFEQFARQDVLGAFHLPAWRLHLGASEQGRKMSLSLHHALYDADSLQILLSDFIRAIRGHNLGPPPAIDQTIVNQLSNANECRSSNEKFWKEKLKLARVIKFPNLTPTIVKEGRASTEYYSSSIAMTTVQDFCKLKGVTIQALGQSVWATLLAQYLGEPEVTFGTVFSGLSNPSQPVAFPTISTLPVHCNTSKDAADLVHDMVTYNASIQRHRFTPLADIQRYANSAGQALFDTIFVYQKPSEATKDRFDWNAITDDLDIDFVASMEMEIPASGNLELRLTHDTQSIPADHASLMIRQFEMILGEMLEGIGHQVSKNLDLMSHVPAKDASIPCSVDLLHQFVERGARNHPDSPALEFIHTLEGGEKSRKTWTYKELEARSNQVAHLIQQHGVKPGGIVAVCMTKCAEASFAFVGILKAGCAFLAMDPDLPLARRTFIMEDSQSQLLFLDFGKADAEMAKLVQTIELTEDLLSQQPKTQLSAPPVQPSATSYCLYTSGTTGTPKGCELTHENAVQAMMSFQRLFSGHWDQNSRWLQFASYWFDVSVLEQFWSWSVGITVVGAPRDLVLEDLAGFIQQANITHIDLTPSLARLLTPEQVPSLWNHVFITGGEALKQEIIDRWGPYKTICNGYGPTEATIGVTMNPFIGDNAKPSNIGPAFDNVGAYVFAPGTDELVMRGAVGELCVSGKLVGKGYLNRPDLTAKAFPFLDRYGERVYRTGDLVRLLADGSVSFIGRADTQAKLRGQRLEIDEIDAVIKSSADTISDVASLIVKSNEGNREMLVSFIVNDMVRSKDLQVSTSDQTRELVQMADQACRDRLPGYMVPTHIIPLTRLPLTVNNKVDTKRLVALFSDMTTQDLQQLKGSGAAQRELQATEQKIADVLARILAIEDSDITPDSNFFSLGLSSVSAISFATALKRNGLKDTSVAMIMKYPTIQGLSRAITKNDGDNEIERNAIKQAQLKISAFERRHRGAAAKALSVQASEIESLAPCTPLQEGLLVESLKGEKRPYFNQFWYDVTGLDVDRLVNAIQRLCELVPILRTAFVNTDEGFTQVVLRKAERSVDLVTPKDGSFEDALGQRRKEWIGRFTSDVLRPLEILIVQTNDKSILAFHAHHAFYDGISWDLMIDRLGELYESSDTPDCGPNFIDALPYGPLCQRPDAKDFWQSRLQNAHFSPLAVATQDGNIEDLFSTKSLRFDSRLEAVRRKLAVSHQAVLQSAFAVALHQLTPQTQSYGVVLSGRSISFDRAEEVIGLMFNTVPYVVDLQTSDDWKELLLRCHQSNAAVVPFQHTPLRDIRRFCGRHPSDPMFDVLFVFQRPDKRNYVEQSPFLKPIETPASAEYPLAVEIELDDSDGILITVAAQKKYTTPESLGKLMEHIEKALDSMAENVEEKISEKFSVETQRTGRMTDQESSQIPQLDGAQDFQWTPEANKIRGFVAQLVGCEPHDVTEHTGIFTLGLDSIDAVKLASRLKKAGLSIPVSQILKAQTIPNMVEAMQGEKKESPEYVSGTRLSVIERQLQSLREAFDEDLQARVERILPATPGQEALIADMIRSQFREYYNSDVLRLNDDVDIQRMRRAWQSVVDASPILRTSFAEVTDPEIDAVFAQVVHQPAKLQITEISISSTEALGEYIEQVRIDVMATLANEPPFRWALATLQDRRYLIISMTHAQYDGHSLALLHEDVAKAYAGDLEPRRIYDGVIESALDATTDKALQFWKDTLNGAKINRISKSTDESIGKTHRAERTISTTAASEARQFCKKHAVSLQALTQASWALLLATYTKQLEVLFGMVLACRDSEEAEAVMFPTVNTIPMRASLHGTGSDMVRYVQSVNNDVRPYQRTPLRAIQFACSGLVQLPSTSSQGGLFDTLFIYQQRPEDENQGRQPLYESISGNSNVEYPIALEAEAIKDELIVRVACKSNILDERGTRTLLQKFDHVLEHLVKTPEKPAVDFSGDVVSICGLPGFKLENDILPQQDMDAEADDTKKSDDEAEPPFEAAIRTALAKVAKVPETDVSSNTKMEAIGIDSISAIKVTALLRKESIKLPVSNILKAQTPKRMAELVESNSVTPAPDRSSAEIIKAHLGKFDLNSVAEANGIDPSHVETVMPATAGQLYMLSMWRKTKGELFYPAFNYRIETPSDATGIKKAWEDVVSHNSILRTVFMLGDSKTPLLQIVLKQSSDVEHDTSSSKSTQPMVHLKLEKMDGGYIASLKIHHALYDAVSLPLLIQKLESRIAGNSMFTTQLKFQDFVATALGPEAQTTQKDFWKKYLLDAKPAALHQPKPEASRKVQIFKPQAFTSCSDLERYCRTSGITVQALLFAIYAKVYAGHASEANDVVFGIYLANRSHLPELDQLAAPTLNLLPLLVRSPNARDLMDIAKKIDSDLRDIGSPEISTASLAEITEWTGVKVDSFINFLKLPEQNDTSPTSKNKTIIEELDPWTEECSRVIQPHKPEGDFLPRELRDFKPADAYQHALDIELSMSNGKLSIGLFCLEDMLSLEDAEKMVAEMLGEIEKVIQ